MEVNKNLREKSLDVYFEIKYVVRGTILRLKHHLIGTPSDIKVYNIVLVDVKKEYQLLLKLVKDDKNKRSIILHEIGAGIGGGSERFKSSLDEECGSDRCGGAQPKKMTIDKFVSS